MAQCSAGASSALLPWSQAETGPTLLSHTQRTWTADRPGSCMSYRDDSFTPQEFVPCWRPRGPREQYPGSGALGTVAKGAEEGSYICSQATGAGIPQLPPSRDFRERVRLDYRFGAHDAMLYPQFWKESAPHLAWVERVETHAQLYQGNIVGYVVQASDWQPTYEGGEYGKLGSPILERLREAFMSVHLLCIPLLGGVHTRHALFRMTDIVADCTALLSDLEVLAGSFRETALAVTRIQRGIAELRAFRLFRLDVQHHVEDESFLSNRMFDMVGVFTRDQKTYDLLFRLGVPVWLVVSELPPGLAESEVVTAIPWEHRVEHTPLDTTPYTLDSGGRKQKSRYDVSPPRYGPERPRALTEREIRALPAPRDGEPRGRSASPMRGKPDGRTRSDARREATHVQRPVLHDNDRRSRGVVRHPDAPRTWILRSYITDPGHQADEGASLPKWIPVCPDWLRGIAASVDRSIEREWHLCCVADPVPQWPFLEKQVHALPPFHLFVKSENRLRFLFPMWVAFRDFWLRRLIRDECKGLDASLWRKVVDGKYFMQPSLLEWIRARRPSLHPPPPHPPRSYPQGRTAEAPSDQSTAPFSGAQLVGSTDTDADVTRERVRLLRKQVEAALEVIVEAVAEPSGDGDDYRAEKDTGGVEEEEGEIGPDPDPVYGLHEPPASGYGLEYFVVHRKRITRQDLAQEDVRAFLIWEIQEAAFRFQVRQLDQHVLRSSHQWTVGMEQERRALWPKIWGGLDGFVPSGIKSPGQTDPDPRVRLPCVYHLWKMACKWPRCFDIPNLRRNTVDKGLSLIDLGEIEQAVWKFYAQTFFDYFGFLPIIPTCMPQNPFTE